jgi:hypothetical protein
MGARDVLLVGVLVFTLAIAMFILFKISSDVINQMILTPAIASDPVAVKVLQDTGLLKNQFDYAIFGVFIGLCLGLIITGWFVAGHPMFMFIYFLGIVISVLVSAVLANTWETITSMSIFGSQVGSFAISNNLILMLPVYMAVVGFIGIIVMFAKPFLVGGSSGGEY